MLLRGGRMEEEREGVRDGRVQGSRHRLSRLSRLKNCSSSSWRRHAFFEQLKARASIAITRSTDRWSWIQYCSYREHARLTRYMMCVMVSQALNGTNTVCIPQDSIAKWTKLLQDTIIKISVEKNKNDRTYSQSECTHTGILPFQNCAKIHSLYSYMYINKEHSFSFTFSYYY